MSKLTPQAQASHDYHLDRVKKSWQQRCIDTQAARPNGSTTQKPNTHLETHQRFDPKGRAILAAEKERE